ncbi:hypothetical protein RFI_25152 [Reticulomyxa filosa]|uniref:Uncharacterized protein n=1 Tax=Reticulomyxa filosa TaxID=46433 RepID=X6MGP9_RETFI|nr:hypothetical protein RFI_25152 [Reticulomyxa filosa]|eukprot:ETO12225.1 hypothetical protein RFI_25152 [Reticulomyxa filosa]
MFEKSIFSLVINKFQFHLKKKKLIYFLCSHNKSQSPKNPCFKKRKSFTPIFMNKKKNWSFTSLFFLKKPKNFSNINNMSNQIFQALKKLPLPLEHAQCVLHKYELIICGDRECYSYHTLKNEYKFICEYPERVSLQKHCVVKLADNNRNDNNQITLLSFGGYGYPKHTLVMKYVSVWSNISDKSNESNNYNQWICFKDDYDHSIIIGRYKDYRIARAVIGGSNNHLLFITYPSDNISVFDLNIFQFIKHSKLPTNSYIGHHCLVSNSKNGQRQEMIKTNQQNYQILL